MQIFNLKTPELDILCHTGKGNYRELEAVAAQLVQQASEERRQMFRPILGGETALMVQLNHRIGNGVSLYFDDLHWLQHLKKQINAEMDALSLTYQEGSNFITVSVADKGEINFIAELALTGIREKVIPEFRFCMYEMEEIMAKRFYFSEKITALDVFDWRSFKRATMDVRTERDKNFGQLMRKLLPPSRIKWLKASLMQTERCLEQQNEWRKIKAARPLEFFDSVSWAKNMLDAWQY